MPTIYVTRILTVFACVLAVSSCASKAREPQVYQVAIRAMQFVPPTVEVHVGDIVVWTNEDIVPHTATASGAFDSEAITSKHQWRYSATKAGDYAYGCSFHPTMKATLTVR